MSYRVENAVKLRRIIKENSLKMIYVPEKYCLSHNKNFLPQFTIFFNQRHFVLVEKCEIKNDEFNDLEENEKIQFGRELIIFLSNSGIIDFHPGNYCFNNKKFILYDTEPCSLTIPSRLFCVSSRLKEIKVNLQNAKINFCHVQTVVDQCDEELKNIRKKEYKLLSQLIKCVAFGVFGLMSLMYISPNFYRNEK